MVELYDPYANMESWTGVPDYGTNYGSYIGQQSQPLSMNQLVSMVRQLQQGMQQQAIGNQSVSVSNPTLLNIPAQIQANITDLRNRLMSMPKPPVMEGDTFTPEPTNVPMPGAGQPPVAGQAPVGSGGGGGTPVTPNYAGNLQPLTLANTPAPAGYSAPAPTRYTGPASTPSATQLAGYNPYGTSRNIGWDVNYPSLGSGGRA